MRQNRPTVWVEAWSVPQVAWLEELGQGEARLRLDTAEWRAWLDGVGVSFAYPVFNPGCGYIEGFVTVRKDRRQRGGRYWTAYRRDGARVRKVYLGGSETDECTLGRDSADVSDEGVLAPGSRELTGSFLLRIPRPILGGDEDRGSRRELIGGTALPKTSGTALPKTGGTALPKTGGTVTGAS